MKHLIAYLLLIAFASILLAVAADQWAENQRLINLAQPDEVAMLRQRIKEERLACANMRAFYVQEINRIEEARRAKQQR